jgi:hypothetical protein
MSIGFSVFGGYVAIEKGLQAQVFPHAAAAKRASVSLVVQEHRETLRETPRTPLSP